MVPAVLLVVTKKMRARIFTRLADVMTQRSVPVFDYVVVDESQDVSVS